MGCGSHQRYYKQRNRDLVNLIIRLMTKKEKELLLKDLCARLPYNVKVAIDFQSYIAWLPADEELDYPYRKHLNLVLDCNKKTIEDISSEPNILYAYPCKERFQMLRGYTYQEDYGVPVKFIKPYLRPLSSMTEEEFLEYHDIKYNKVTYRHNYKRFDVGKFANVGIIPIEDYLDWLNSHHFDYRGLIEKGLALEAPEGMYNA